MTYAIIDTHCDALLKLWENKQRRFYDDSDIDTNVVRLKRGNVRVQFFAIFIEPWLKQEQKFTTALEQVELFYEKVLKADQALKHIRNWKELKRLKEGEIGAILALEGTDAIGDDVTKLKMLYELGVLSVGLTWNYANLCADGALEPRGAGLTELGKRVVHLNNERNVLTDVSHLSERGFWDVIEIAERPFASHSNARALCDHPRNLSDEQIKALVTKNGYIGLVFYPIFLTGKEEATIDDVLRHLEHLCELGAGRNVGFGSDFDGIEHHVTDLCHSGHYDRLVNELLKRYSDETVRGFLSENFKRFVFREI